MDPEDLGLTEVRSILLTVMDDQPEATVGPGSDRRNTSATAQLSGVNTSECIWNLSLVRVEYI